MTPSHMTNRYHATVAGSKLSDLRRASEKDLETWAHDPNCIEMEECAKVLAERLQEQDKRAAERQAARDAERHRLSERRQKLQDNPFDPRTEVSADAIHIASRIVKHLWIIFVLLPFVAVVLWAILAALK